MEFCPECESLLYPEKDPKGKVFLKCRKCGYKGLAKKGEQPERMTISEKMKIEIDDIPIIEEDIDTLPSRREICDKCGNDIAYYWQLQTRSADESMTTFFRCKKCGHTWREYE